MPRPHPCVSSTERVILVTGATGFVGGALTRELVARGHTVRTNARRLSADVSALGATSSVTGDLRDSAWMAEACRGVRQVIHPAGISHRVADEADHLAVNRDGTLALARAAATGGVGRFVFVSSVAVYGVQVHDSPVHEDSPPVMALTESYGRSKIEAEQGLREIEASTGMEVVIVRPPLVYGPGVKGNLQRLLRLADEPVPLPLGLASGRRSIVALGNLVDFLIACALHPEAAGETFVVADREPVTTAELVRAVKHMLGHRPALLPVPEPLLYWPARLIGRGRDVRLLFGSFELHAQKAERLLGWNPPHDRRTSLEAMVRSYRGRDRS